MQPPVDSSAGGFLVSGVRPKIQQSRAARFREYFVQ